MIFLAISLKVIVEWEMKWSCDVGYIIYYNWIPGGTWEVLEIKQ
jgi:hypothetical protein